MMSFAAQYRFVVASLAALIIYGLTNYEVLTRRFGDVDGSVYFAGLFVVVLLSSFFIKNRSLPTRLSWAVIIPEIGSLVGYALLTVLSLHNEGSNREIAFSEWLTIATIAPFFLVRVWAISLMLLLFCGVDYYTWHRRSLPTMIAPSSRIT